MKKIFKIILFIFLVGIIYFYIHKHSDEFKTVLTIEWYYTGLLAFFILAHNVLAGVKLYVISRKLGLQVTRFYEWVEIFLVSRFINFHVNQGAFMYRFVKLKKDFQFPYTNSLSANIFYTWFEISFAFLISCLALLILPVHDMPHYKKIQLVSFLIVLLLLFAPSVLTFLLKNLHSQKEIFKWAQEKCKDLGEQLDIQLRDKKTLVILSLLTLLSFAVSNCATHVTFLSIHKSMGLIQTILFTLIIMISRSFNILPGNIGVAELICGYFSHYAGGTVAEGILVSTIYRAIEYVLLGLVSSVFFLLSWERKTET